MPGGLEDSGQQQYHELLQEMANVPRRSTHICVPNPHYNTEDNTRQIGGRLGSAELLAVTLSGFDPAMLKEALASPESDHCIRKT